MSIIVLLFNNLLKENLGLTCGHGPTCGMYQGVMIQTWISLAVIAVIIIIGIVIMLTKPKERIIIKTKKVKGKKKKIDKSGLDKKEKTAVELLEKEGGMFQRSLMEEMGIGKVGMTRLLDKLEAKQIVERKRRGMNNFIVLQQ
jgi:uncharacterized membrane protein